MLVIGPPGDPAYCAANPTPTQCAALSVDKPAH
jgi:hypothetical protein